MARDYSWSRNSIPTRMNTIGEVAGLLGLSRWQARRRLVASGLPYRVYTRRWTNPNSGKWYSRRAIGIPQKTAAELLKQDIVNELGQGWKSFAKAIKMKNPAPPKHFEDLIQSIRDIPTDPPPRPIRLKKPTIRKSFKVRLPRIRSR